MRRPIFLITLLALMLASAAPAAASTTDDIIRDCQHSPTGELQGTYTRAQLKKAYDNLPGDVREYSSCPDAIHQALLASIANPSGSGGGPTGGGGGGTPGGGDPTGGGSDLTGGGTATTTPTVVPRNTGSKAPVTLDGGTVQPGSIPSIGRDAHSLPTPLLVLLVLLAVGALAPAATTIGRRVIARCRA